MVNEITLNGEVVHLRDITKPHEPELDKKPEKSKPAEEDAAQSDLKIEDLPEALRFEEDKKWPLPATFALREHFSDETIASLHALYKEGKEPPAPKSDAGWGGRVPKAEENEEEAAANAVTEAPAATSGSGRGQGRDRGRGRGRGRGGRGGGGGDRPWNADTRKVVSQVGFALSHSLTF